jgi:hypothetical protein
MQEIKCRREDKNSFAPAGNQTPAVLPIDCGYTERSVLDPCMFHTGGQIEGNKHFKQVVISQE